MYTHSKTRLTFLRYCLLAIFTTATATGMAQIVNVYPIVLPPYSNRLTDYTQKPGKLSVTLQSGAFRISPLYVYIEGKIASIDGDIQIYTQPGTKPKGGGIMLTQNSIRQLTFNELSSIFDDQTLLYKGITREQVLKGGLPEGPYHICFKVFDYTTNQLISPDEPSGCSNMFSISAIEAPIIIAPQNDIEIPATTPQNILFQWAQPAGTTPGLKYTLKILELDNPNRNPEDAFNSTGYPVFFETEAINTMYLYTVANPPLTIGKKYAFRVTVHQTSVATRDVIATTYFRNGGNSEVNIFTYVPSQKSYNITGSHQEEKIHILTPVNNNPDSALFAGENTDLFLRWTLNDPSVYSDPIKSKQNKGPNKDTLVVKSAKYRIDFFNASGSITNPIRTVFSGCMNPFYQTSQAEADKFMVKNQSYRFKVTLFDTISKSILGQSDLCAFKYVKAPVPEYTKTVINGRIRYRFQGEPETYPVHATIKLITGYFLKTSDGKEIEVTQGNGQTPMYLQLGQGTDKNKSSKSTTETFNYSLNSNFQNFVDISSVQTDGQGNFSITYNKPGQAVFGTVNQSFNYTSEGKSYSGVLSYSLRVYIESPYYYQPETDIVLSHSDTVNVGDIETWVKGYSLKAFVTRGYGAVTQVSEQITGKTVYLFRKKIPSGIPSNEGTEGMAHFDAGEQFGYYLLIGKEVAAADVDKDGNKTASVTFNRLISNLVPGDEYYMMLQGSNINTAQKISYTENSGNNEFFGSGSISSSFHDFNIGQLGQQYEGNTTVETGEILPPWITQADIQNKTNLVTSQLAGQKKPEQKPMMLQTGGDNTSKTYADNIYQSMAGTNYAVQSSQHQYMTNPNQTGISLNQKGNVSSADPSLIIQGLEALASYPIITKDGKYSFKVKTAYRIVTDQYPKSVIKGKLVYTWPNKPGTTMPLSNTNITLVKCSVAQVEGVSKYFIPDNANYQASELKTVKTDAQGNFTIEFDNVYLGIGQSFPGGSGKVCSGIASKDTYFVDENNLPHTSLYQFQYINVNTSTLKTVFRIIVPNNSIYTSPDNDIIVKPLETVDLGTLTSDILSRKLKGEVYAKFNTGSICDYYHSQCGSYDYQVDASNIDCYLIKPASQIESNINPGGEGQSSVYGTLEEMPGYEIVDKGTTDGSGNFSFENTLFNSRSPQLSYPPLVYFRSSNMQEGINPSFTSYMVNNYLSILDYTPKYLFNSDYNYIETDLGLVQLQMNVPIIKGKVVSDMNINAGISGAKCNLTVYKTPFAKANGFGINLTAFTDTAGYFIISLDQFKEEDWDGIKSFEDWQTITADLSITKDGYGYKNSSQQWSAEWVKQFPNNTFLPGKQIALNNIVMGVRGDLNGKIFCKTASSPIPAYLQFVEVKSDGTEGLKGKMQLFDNGTFQHFKVLPGNHKIIVIPKDPAYFTDTIPFHIYSTSETTANLEVFERLHRVLFFVKEKAGNLQNPVSGAIIALCDGQGTTSSGSTGKVELNFKNISVDNLTLKVSGPAGSNYIPKYITFKNEESETVTTLPTVYLEKGIPLTGKVLLNGQPTNKARVFADVKNVSGMDFSSGNGYAYASKSVFEAEVHNDGTFSFNGLPPEVSGKDVPVYAITNEPNQTIVGENKLVHIPVQQPLILSLTAFPNMKVDNIWGFPLQLTKLEQLPNNHIRVFGIIKLNNYSPGFDIINEENIQFPMNNIEMVKSGTQNGVDIYEPVGSSVTINTIRKIKLKYAKTYNTELVNNPNSNLQLEISKNNLPSANGVVNGYVRIIDNSFKFPSSYLTFDPSQFYFFNHKNQDNGLNNILSVDSPSIVVFNSGTTGNGDQTVKYNLKQKDKFSLDFNFIGFKATADSYNSTIEGSVITLDATMLAPIKNAGTSEIHIPKLVLRDNKIDPVSSSSPIVLTLNDGGTINNGKQWKFEARNWKVDPSEGGLVSHDCMLRTGKIDVPFGLFNLRSDFAYFDQPNVNGINLGGIPIQFKGKSAAFSYNPVCGSDKKGHWQLILFPQNLGTPVALLPGSSLSANIEGNLELETVSLLSNGEDVFTISPNALEMKLYKLATFKPMLVTTLQDGFQLFGSTKLKIPRVPDALGATLTFSKSKPMVIEPLFIPFTGKGNIKFEPDKYIPNDPVNGNHQYWSTGQFIAYGSMSEPNKLEPVFVKLTHKGPVNPVTDIVESDKAIGQEIKIGSQNTSLESISCKMHADATDWDNFTYEGDMKGFAGLKDKNHLKFTVFGEIKADGANLNATGLTDNKSSSFAGMELTYDKGKIRGSLTLPETQIGSFKAAASLNILMDSNGWCFYGYGTASDVPIPDPCQANIGFLIGYYNDAISTDIENTVLKYAVRKVLPEKFKTGKLHGFFTLAGRDLPIKGLDIDYDVKVAKAYLEVPVAGIDVYLYMNGNSFVGGIDAKVEVKFGLNSISCTNLYGSATACIDLSGGIVNGSVNAGGCAGLSTSLGVVQQTPMGLSCGETIFNASLDFKASFEVQVHPFNVNFHLGSNGCALCQ